MRRSIKRAEQAGHEDFSIGLGGQCPDVWVIIGDPRETGEAVIDGAIGIRQSNVVPELASVSGKIATEKNLSIAWPNGHGADIFCGRPGPGGVEAGVPGAVRLQPDHIIDGGIT